jgi:uracil-DNA glycosylase
MTLASIYTEINNHPANVWAKQLGWKSLYTASEKSKIVIIGQAPGRQGQESGIPWNDKSGDTLRKWLGVTKEQFYNPDNIALIPMDFYYPGKGVHGDLPPRKDFAPLWHPKLFAMMPEVQLTILVGNYAQEYYLGEAAKRNLTENVRNFTEFLPQCFPIVHPSPLNFRWQAKNPWFQTDVIPVLQTKVGIILTQQ